MIYLLLLSVVPYNDVARERVDVLEVNHFYDEQGRLVFDQLIGYDWSPDEARDQIRDWRLIKHQSWVPVYNHRTKYHEVMTMDGELIRVIRATMIRESWTQYDPELLERDFLPKEHRKLFYTPNVVRSRYERELRRKAAEQR